MKEVAGAVIATSLVLVAVFVPVALFPGTTGILFRQFALTIAFSVSISAFNALTLTPALSAIFLGHHRERAQGRFFRGFNRAVEAVTNAYRATVRRAIGWRFAALVLFACVLGATYWVYQLVPRAFIPEDDQGFIMFIIQAPQGASLTYTRDICAKTEQLLSHVPEISAAFTVAGFSQAGNAPNRAIIYANLQPFDQRKGEQHSAAAIIQRLRGPLFGIPGALVVPFNPPAVQGLGQFGGFQFELEDLGRNSLQTIANTANTLVAQGNAGKDLTGLFTSFTANDPQYLVRIDREKAKSLQVPFSQITDAQMCIRDKVWGSHEGTVIPILSVTRINGEFFAFLAIKDGQGLVARQKLLKIGEAVGNDYAVLDGIQPGDHIIVSGLQFLRDGAPVMEQVVSLDDAKGGAGR